jgi:hypothetical protein
MRQRRVNTFSLIPQVTGGDPAIEHRPTATHSKPTENHIKEAMVHPLVIVIESVMTATPSGMVSTLSAGAPQLNWEHRKRLLS